MTTPASGDKSILVRTADGKIVPFKITAARSEGDRCVPVITASGKPVLMFVNPVLSVGDQGIPVLCADGKVVLVKSTSLYPAGRFWFRVECDTLSEDPPGIWLREYSGCGLYLYKSEDQGASWQEEYTGYAIHTGYKIDDGAWVRDSDFDWRSGLQWPLWWASTVAVPSDFSDLWIGCYTIWFNHSAGPYTGRFIVRTFVGRDPNGGDLVFSTEFSIPDGAWSDFQVIKDGKPVGAV